ncbi:palmitoyltransferase ZDHHC21-like [Gigantopelta aegis]|uniref:palmitoyltransferase ZDHHC21-like n=1 Tax=Gigantopelta aegis TaxID=1735272 RepID=UPI001B888A75|nr:palmitoyltransferase ZDHHC21-like [Gigantopelta aegis]
MDISILTNLKQIVSSTRQPTSEYADHISVTKCPLIGRIHFVKDKYGIMQLGFVVWYWIYGTFIPLFIVLIPGYHDGYISGIFIAVYLYISAMCLTSLARAATLNPGRIPLISDDTVLDEADVTFCKVCNRKRPARAHHCRRCRQCVMRMDHHCPWINNCVGADNHYAFFLLLLYSFLLSFLAFVLCMLHFWVYPKCKSCDPEVFYMKHSIWFMYLMTGLAFNMAMMMGIQLVGQHFNLITNRTTLENMQRTPNPEEMKFRDTLDSYRDLFGGNSSSWMICWLCPFRHRRSSVYRPRHVSPV